MIMTVYLIIRLMSTSNDTRIMKNELKNFKMFIGNIIIFWVKDLSNIISSDKYE